MNEQEEQIILEPDRELVFVCGPTSMSAILKLHAAPHVARGYHYQFEIRASNKPEYKVSEASGSFRKSPHVIEFYLKNSGNITKNLRDKFQVKVINKQTGKEVLRKKLGVVIESAAPARTELNILEGSSFNTTRFASAYTMGLSNTRHSLFDRSLSQSNVLASYLTAQNSPERIRRQREEKLKTKLNETIRLIEQKQRRIVQLERENRNKKAKARMILRFTALLMFLSFVLGLSMGGMGRASWHYSGARAYFGGIMGSV